MSSRWLYLSFQLLLALSLVSLLTFSLHQHAAGDNTLKIAFIKTIIASMTSQEFPLLDPSSFDQLHASLGSDDQANLGDLLARLNDYDLAIRNAVHPVPYQVTLLSLLIEEHKQVQRLQRRIEEM